MGEYWACRQVTFDQVYSGPSTRQVDTARLVGEAYRREGLPWPEPVAMDELDEYQAEAVLQQTLPHLLEKDDHIRKLHRAFENSLNPTEQLKNFQRMYEVVIRMWVHGEFKLSGVEPWPEFCARVDRGVSQIMAAGRKGRQVVAFTSGGPIGVAMQRALNTSPETTLQLTWMVRNGSFSEFLFFQRSLYSERLQTASPTSMNRLC